MIEPVSLVVDQKHLTFVSTNCEPPEFDKKYPLLSSPYFKFICKTCINSNNIDKSNSISDSDSMNSLNKLSNKINDRSQSICIKLYVCIQII